MVAAAEISNPPHTWPQNIPLMYIQVNLYNSIINMSFHTTYRTALWQKLAKGKPSLSLLFPFLLTGVRENKFRKLIPPRPSLSISRHSN